jgi:hypothetical protein
MAKTSRIKKQAPPAVPDEIVQQLPQDRLLLYGLLWQFETWLREMVYVELMARYGADWSKHIEGDQKRAQTGDSRLIHMPTRERLKPSYILFSQLQKTISKHWRVFHEYLPPKDIWKAKLSEIDQIRNRVAHFRRGHHDDINRVRQMLKDVDQGFWRFCTSYNRDIPIIDPAKDVVARAFAHLDPFPWTEVEPNTFARIGHAPDDLAMAVTVEILRRPWLNARQPGSVMGRPGFLYDVTMSGRRSRIFDYGSFLKQTQRFHPQLCHICLSAQRSSIRLTVPSISGRAVIVPMLQEIAQAAHNTLRPDHRKHSFSNFDEGVSSAVKAMDALAMQWPEYVLGPSNPLTFLGPEMPCNFFAIS